MTWQPERSYRETARRRDLSGVDLADVHAVPRRRKPWWARIWETFGRGTNAVIVGLGLAPWWDRLSPGWDHPSRSPSVWIFAAAVVAFFLAAFGALELVEWIVRRWGLP